MNEVGTSGSVVAVDMGYGSGANYRLFEGEMPEVTALVPYNTMLREASRKWCSDDSRVMNWFYDEKSDEYTDNDGVVFKWHTYSHRMDKNAMPCDFKIYRAEAKDENNQDIPAAYTKNGNGCQISINPSWEYQKARM